MPVSEKMLLGALEAIEAIGASRSAAAIAYEVSAHSTRLGASYARVVEIRGAGADIRARALIDTAPEALSFSALQQRQPNIADVARRFVGENGVVRDAGPDASCPPDAMRVGAEHVQAGAAATFVGAPLHSQGVLAGYGLYVFAARPNEREALERVVRFVCQAALNQLTQLSDDGRAAPASPLTPRQREVLALVADGKSDGDIAAALALSQNTVHEHIEEAKRRIGVRTRVQPL